MGAVDVHAHDGFAELRVGRLDEVVVEVFLVVERVEALEHKLEQRAQVLGRRSGHKDVGVPEGNGAGDGETHRGRLAAAAGRRERDGRAEDLVGGDVQEGEQRLGLVEGAARRRERAGGLRVGEGLRELGELLGGLVAGAQRRRPVVVRGHRGDGADVGGGGEDVEFIIDEDRGRAVREREHEALVEAACEARGGLSACMRVAWLRRGPAACARATRMRRMHARRECEGAGAAGAALESARWGCVRAQRSRSGGAAVQCGAVVVVRWGAGGAVGGARGGPCRPGGAPRTS